MSKKILVIEDWDKLIGELTEIATRWKTKSNLWMDFDRALMKHEQDVIEFEAEVETETTPESMPGRDFTSQRTIIYIPNKFADGDKLQVFVVKEKKQ